MNIQPVQIIKEFRQTVLFSSKDIEALLKVHAMQVCELAVASAKILFNDETEGSPPYKIGIKARVELTSPLE